MASRRKTWAEKLTTGTPHVDILERAYTGLPVGARLLISSPRAIQACLLHEVPRGTSLSIPEQRAREAGAACASR